MQTISLPIHRQIHHSQSNNQDMMSLSLSGINMFFYHVVVMIRQILFQRQPFLVMERVLTTANTVGTTGLTSLLNYRGARDIKFLVTHPTFANVA
jgi:hypothetical protein